MRELKFRGKIWRDFFDPTLIGFMGKDYKDDFVYGQLAYDDKGNPLILGEALEVNNDYVNFEYWIPVIPETIGQYINIKDKNDQEIYEGDILRSDEYPFNSDGSDNYYAEVLFWEDVPCCCGYYTHKNPKATGIRGISAGCGENFGDISDGKIFEVIGNIHNNPDLIEEIQDERD